MTDVPNDAHEPPASPPLTASELSYLDRLQGELRLFGKSKRADILHVKLAIEMFMNIEEDPAPPPLPPLDYVGPKVKAGRTGTPHVPAATPAEDATDVAVRHLIEITDVDGEPSSELVQTLGEADAAFDRGEDYWLNITLPNGAVLTVATGTLDMVPAPTTAPAPPVATAPEPEPEPPPTFEGEIGVSPAFEEVTAVDDSVGASRAAIGGAGMLGDLADRRGCLMPIVAVIVALVIIAGGIALLINGGDGDEGDVAPSTSAPADPDSSDSGGLPGTDDGPADVSDGIPDPPIVLNPCDLLTTSQVQDASGTPWTGVASEASNGNRQICHYRGDGSSNVGAPFLQMEATLNSNSDDFFVGFQDRHPTLIRELAWGRGNAEIRLSDGFVSLWGHVIADDPLGRDLFVWVSLGNASDAATGADAVEEIGTLLRGELLANQ